MRNSQGRGLTRDDVTEWLEGYKAAWETRDADKVVALFTEDATYQELPCAAPLEGRQGIRDYWTEATGGQQDVDFSYQVLSVSGNTGIAHWRTNFTRIPSGSRALVDGIFVLEFTPNGLCESLKEWWHVQEQPIGEEQ
ncbi:MAG: nuclear transport factor 2 family protein [Pseudomonadota bacterium]